MNIFNLVRFFAVKSFLIHYLQCLLAPVVVA